MTAEKDKALGISTSLEIKKYDQKIDLIKATVH